MKEQIFEILSLEEMQTLALHEALRRAGVKDPVEFLKANLVKYRSAFRSGVGMSIIVLDVQKDDVGE